MTARSVALLALLAGCNDGARLLSAQAVELALRRQTTLWLDEELAWEIQGALERTWEMKPGLTCVFVRPVARAASLDVLVWDEQLEQLPPEVEEAWQREQLLTGNATVDGVLEEFLFTGVEYYRGDILDYDSYHLRFAALVNGERFVEHFVERTGIAAELPGLGGDSGDVTLARAPAEVDTGRGEGWWLRFDVGWGDCPSGCIDHHLWDVLVPDAAGPAVLLEETGDPLVRPLVEPCPIETVP